MTETNKLPMFFPPGSSCDDGFTTQHGIVADTPEQAAHLEDAGWVIAADFFKPQTEREAQARQQAAQAAAEAAGKAAEEEKRSRAAREKSDAEAKAQKEAADAAAKIAQEREERDRFLTGVYAAQVRPLEQRRSWVNDRLRTIAHDLGSALLSGWDGWNPQLVEEALNLDSELETISQRLAEADAQLADARAKEQEIWRK